MPSRKHPVQEPRGYMNHLYKCVPTAMDWSPTFYRGYVDVVLSGPREDPPLGDEGDANCHVFISGGDDCHVARWDLTREQALALFNSITLIHDRHDLRGFLPGAIGTSNNNGFPHGRVAFPAEHVHPQPVDELAEYIDGPNSPETWNWGGPRRKEDPDVGP